MFNTFYATLSPMLVMLILILLGFAANRLRLSPADTALALSKLENYFFVPALIINTFMTYCSRQSIVNEYRLILYGALCLAISIPGAIFLSKFFVKDGYERNIYKYALAFANFSFMGNAIVPEIFGQEMLYRYMLFTVPLNIAVYTWGLYILIPNTAQKSNPLKKLANPILFSIIIGFSLGFFNLSTKLPQFVISAVSSCAACMGPCAMLLSGFIIGDYSLPSLLTDKKVYVASAARLFVFPSVLMVILKAVGADNASTILTLFAYGTPLGLNTVVFPAAYGGDTRPGAAMATVSNVLCIISLPLLYTLATFFLM